MTKAPATLPVRVRASLASWGAPVRQAGRTVVSCLLAYAVAAATGIPQPYWAMITAVGIIQASTSQTISAGRDQIIGTAIGAIFGVAALAAEVYGEPRFPVFVLALAPLAILTAVRPNMRLACITLVIVVLIPTDSNPFSRAVDRVAEILIGAVSGILVSYVLFPSRAQREAYSRAAAMMEELVRLLTVTLGNPRKRIAIDDYVERTTEGLRLTVAAVLDAKREHANPSPHSAAFLTRLVPIMRRLQSDVLFVGRAMESFQCDRKEVCDALTTAAHAFSALMRQLAQAIAADSPRGDLLAEVRGEIEAIHPAIEGLEAEEAVAVRFVLQMLERDIVDLAVALDGSNPEDEASERPRGTASARRRAEADTAPAATGSGSGGGSGSRAA